MKCNKLKPRCFDDIGQLYTGKPSGCEFISRLQLNELSYSKPIMFEECQSIILTKILTFLTVQITQKRNTTEE